MKIKTVEFKKVCSAILQAVDNNALTPITETLELKTVGKTLHLNVTNKEYYVTIAMELDEEGEDFHATVNANLFLKLISQITTETVELTISGNTLTIVGNGNYNLPLIYEGDKIVDLPEITIGNVTSSFDIKSSILNRILNYNSKQLSETSANDVIHRLYYVDNKGAITFAMSGCVNNFELPVDIKMLFSDKLVKLFKLFKSDEDVHIDFGYDKLTDNISQNKIRFVSKSITLTSVVPNTDTLLKKIPVDKIRDMATADYPFNVVVKKESLIEAINRLSLFFTKDDLKTYSTLIFSNDSVSICFGYDRTLDKNNKETITYDNAVEGLDTTIILDVVMLKNLIEASNEETVTLAFSSDGNCVVLKTREVLNIIPKCS